MLCGEAPADGTCRHKLNSQREHALGRALHPHSAHLIAKAMTGSGAGRRACVWERGAAERGQHFGTKALPLCEEIKETG